MSQITIPLLYLASGLAFGMNRLPRFAQQAALLQWGAFVTGLIGAAWHALAFREKVWLPNGLDLSIANAVSMIGLQLALIALIGATDAKLRGMAAGLLCIAAVAAAAIGAPVGESGGSLATWQLQAHVLIALFSYGLLTAGAIVAGYALALDRRLKRGRFGSGNPLFAPLETTETMLFGVTAAGFAGLLVAVVSGLVFVEDLFAQHLVHKTTLSIVALLLFGVLLAGRLFAGWRGRRAVYLYLWGFGMLCLAYFGSRVVLEEILGRSWG
ncbi:MAG: cytochrome c biogenesis protein CcsA [Woeseiaceae bacterium]|nr:cytochrome c biogenesis protein CcsA [Woeseiaceae bacterium]